MVYGVLATSTIDLDSDGYFDLCNKNQNHCNQNVFWSQTMAKMLWRPGLRLEPRWGNLQRSPRPRSSWILGRKDGEKKRRGRNVRKEGGEEGQKGGGGNRRKGGGGDPTDQLCSPPSNPGDATGNARAGLPSS